MRKLHLLIVVIILAVFIVIFSNKVETATETSNATFDIGNEVPVIIDFRVEVNATGLTADAPNGSNFKSPVNVTQFVNFTIFYTDLNADDVSILVCKTNSATASGCGDAQYFINETTFTSANHSALNKTTLNLATFLPYYNNTNSTIAYLFLSDGSGVSSSVNVSFSVNHAPTQGTEPTITGTGGSTNYTNETYTAGVIGVYDVDNANNTIGFAGFKPIYVWYIENGTNWHKTSITTVTFNCAEDLCNETDTLKVEVLVKDLHGYSNSSSGPTNSSNLTIVNADPSPPTGFQLKDGTGSFDGTAIFQTHARNGTGPEIIWTDGVDPDNDVTAIFICARLEPVDNLTADAACNGDGIYNTSKVNAGEEKITIGGTSYNDAGSNNVTYLVLITTDGTANSSVLNISMHINNSKPIVDPTPLNITESHDSTPWIEWNVSDWDDGKVGGWPADTLTHFIRVGSDLHLREYNSSENANNNSYEILPVIPWNTTTLATDGNQYWSNRTVHVDIWVEDGTGTTYGNSTIAQDNFTLFDYLARVVYINMSNDAAASPWLSCNQTGAASLCQLTPLEFSNTTVAIHIAVEDRDGDCSALNHDAWLGLCKNQTNSPATDACTSSTGYDYTFNLSFVASAANNTRCFFQRTSNTTSLNSPEFFINNTHFKLFVNISNNASVERSYDELENGTWFYVGLNAVNYSNAVTLGNGSIKLGAFSWGSTRYVVRNYGNLNLSLEWNISNPNRSGGTEIWPLNGTDLRIDDDNNITLDTEGILPATNISRDDSPGSKFSPFGIWNLAICVVWTCDTTSWNETLDTYWHINPPSNLTGGTYHATIWLTASS